MIDNCSGYGLDETGRCVDRVLRHELEAPRENRFGASTAKNAGARGLWTSGQFELPLEPARLPWTTRCVAHRASLCPLAHSPLPRLSKLTPIKRQKPLNQRYKGRARSGPVAEPWRSQTGVALIKQRSDPGTGIQAPLRGNRPLRTLDVPTRPGCIWGLWVHAIHLAAQIERRASWPLDYLRVFSTRLR